MFHVLLRLANRSSISNVKTLSSITKNSLKHAIGNARNTNCANPICTWPVFNSAYAEVACSVDSSQLICIFVLNCFTSTLSQIRLLFACKYLDAYGSGFLIFIIKMSATTSHYAERCGSIYQP